MFKVNNTYRNKGSIILIVSITNNLVIYIRYSLYMQNYTIMYDNIKVLEDSGYYYTPENNSMFQDLWVSGMYENQRIYSLDKKTPEN